MTSRIDESGPIEARREIDPAPPDVDPALQRAFVLAVLEANAAMLTLSLGVLFVVIAGRARLGASLLAVGALLGVDLVRRVRARPTGANGPPE